MPLARLDNFLKNLNGNTLYVDPSELDSSDSIENRGNSRIRPFKTIQRALLEAARFSYVAGSNNDLFDQTTILISPGTHYIDNRPGYWVDSNLVTRDVNNISRNISEFNISTNYDINDPLNELYIFNSIDGGVIVPRGASIVATDPRKTKIRPRYVPDPNLAEISRSAIFRLTGGCYIYGFTIFDANIIGKVYNTYSSNTVVPNFSHHKLTVFEYADGKNLVTRNGDNTGKTDLDMYYYKLSLAYGQQSNRPIIQGSDNLQSVPDENRIVGELGTGEITIISAKSGDGVTGTNVITVVTETPHGLAPFTPVIISGIGDSQSLVTKLEYNGNYIVAQVPNDYEFTYIISKIPTENLEPSVAGAVVKVISDTVSSASAYVFNCSLRSNYGLCGLHADGSKVSGFRSMVTAQFTGISLQKDDRAFVKYDDVVGAYRSQDSYGVSQFLHQESLSRYRPDWESFHIKASNDAFIQCVSVFAIGYAKQFIADTGGDQSITNSNSNFGSISLYSKGFKKDTLPKDNHGFITHIIPPKDIPSDENAIRFYPIDTTLTNTLLTSNSYSRIYFEGYNDVLNPPPAKVRGYSIGGQVGDKLYYKKNQDEYSISITSSGKINYNVTSIDLSTNELTLESNVGIETGLSVTFFSKNGLIPDGIEGKKVYFIRPFGGNDIKLYDNIVNAESDVTGTLAVDIKNTIGVTANNLFLQSKISDKQCGDIGHPVQWDSTNKNWYIKVISGTETANFWGILPTAESPVAFVKRKLDSRLKQDKIYRVRYVIPKEAKNASAPSSGFIVEKASNAVNSLYSQSNNIELVSPDGNEFSLIRNKGIIVDAWYDIGTQVATIVTSKPHNLNVDQKISINNLKSTNEPNPVGLGTGTGFNGEFMVKNIINEIQFTYDLGVNPGDILTGTSTFQSWLTDRDCAQTSNFRIPPYTIYDSFRASMPYFACKQIDNDYQIYTVKEIQPYVEDSADGIYHLTLNSYKNTPTVDPFNIKDYKLSQNIEDLYPIQDLDNPTSDPESSTSIASRRYIGQVDTNNLEYSTTKESVIQLFKDFSVGKEITQIVKTGNECTITTSVNHGLKGIKQVSIINPGSGFLDGSYYDIPLCGGSGTNATINVSVSGGQVVSATIANYGSGYSISDELSIKGIPGATSNAVVKLTGPALIFNPSDSDAIQILGAKNAQNNGAFFITSVTSNTITYTNSNGVNETSSSAVVILSGVGYPITSVPDGSLYDSNTNTTTLTVNSTTPHSFVPGNKVIFDDQSIGVLTVSSVISNFTFTVIGNASSATKVFSVGLIPTLKDTNSSNENLNSRHYSIFSGYKSRVGTEIGISDNKIFLSSVSGLNKGDFIQINDEIMLINRISGGELTVKRSIFGTKLSSHIVGTAVKRIDIIPVELRRNSILRASGHTFEYTGFGPGNYSTGMPSNQDRVLTDSETLISQALTTEGGLVVYTGMNSRGEFYIGRKKFDALTGEEIVVGSPEKEGRGGAGTGGEVNFEQLSVDRLTANVVTITQTLDASSANAFVNNLTVDGIFTTSGALTLNNNTQSTNCTTGAIVVAGGVGIGKNLNVCGGLTVAQNSTLSGDLTVSGTSTFNGLLDANNGASIDNVQIGITENNTIDTSTGNLKLSAAGTTIELLKNSSITGTLTVSGTSTFNGLLDANNGASIDNVQIGITDNNTIDVSTGELILKASPNNLVQILNNTRVDGSLTITGPLNITGSFGGGDLNSTGLFADNVRIAVADSNTIDTSAGNLKLGAIAGSKVEILNETSIAGSLSLTQNVVVGTNLSVGLDLTTNGRLNVNNGARIDNIRIGIANDNTIDTTSGNLILNSTSSAANSILLNNNTTVAGSLTITGALNIGGQVGIGNLSSTNLTVDNIQIGVTDDNTIDTSTGNLKLSAVNNVQILKNTDITGTLTISGLLDANGGSTIDNIRIGVANDNTIDTSSGNLVLGAATGSEVQITKNTSVTGSINATGNVTGSSFIGNGTIPIGGIIMWAGLVVDIPLGWKLCDGIFDPVSNLTPPDLRDKFIIGAGVDAIVSGQIRPATAVEGIYKSTGGTKDAVVVTHNHNGFTGNESPPHSHDFTITADTEADFKVGPPDSTSLTRWFNTDSNNRNYSGTTATSPHNHSIAPSGESGTNKNLPPYYALAFIMRTA
jgi:hypothetical protein